jgi:hypothetical protein
LVKFRIRAFEFGSQRNCASMQRSPGRGGAGEQDLRAQAIRVQPVQRIDAFAKAIRDRQGWIGLDLIH